MSSSVVVGAPLAVRIRFAHATIQHLADRCGADVLHIKGVAIDRSIAAANRVGSDADVLVRPGHVGALLSEMGRHGWDVRSTFESGSPFGHAVTLTHEVWGFADVHRHFPGIGASPERAFDRLWSERSVTTIAGVPCPVPSLAAQSLILVLNAARAGGHAQVDLSAAWIGAGETRTDEILALRDELEANVGFAAATGGLEDFHDAREYDLWRLTVDGGTRREEWMARIRAAPNRREALRVVWRAPQVNVDHLAHRLGRRPTWTDVAREFFARPARGMREEIAALVRRRGRRPR
jgi:hypothetical protein